MNEWGKKNTKKYYVSLTKILCQCDFSKTKDHVDCRILHNHILYWQHFIILKEFMANLLLY